jgi:hypothetical protein
VIQEIAITLRKAPQPRPLRTHERAVMLLVAFCISLLLGSVVLCLLQGKHYVVFFILILPLLVGLRISGLLLRGSIMPR